MCKPCAELTNKRSRDKHQRLRNNDKYKENKKIRSDKYLKKLKESGKCPQCGKPNDRLPKSMCTSCVRKGKESLNRRKESNPDKVKESTKERGKRYYIKNKEEVLLRNRDSKARRRGAEGKFTPAEWRSLLDKYEHKCLWCGKTGVKLTVDHVLPVSKGGTNYIDNIQPLCDHCNKSKNARIIDFRPFGAAIMDWT